MKKKRMIGMMAVFMAGVLSIHGTCFAKGRWRPGSEAWAPGEKIEAIEKMEGVDIRSKHENLEKIYGYKPEDWFGTQRDGWWYSNEYYDEEGVMIKNTVPNGTAGGYWIDEDKDNNRDGLFYRYNFRTPDTNSPGGFLYPNYDLGNGSCYNEEGIWLLNGEIQTISERPWKEGTLRGLWPGVYWDQYHKSRLEVDMDELVRYYEEGKGTPSMVLRIVDRRDRLEEVIGQDNLTYKYIRLDENPEIMEKGGFTSFSVQCKDDPNGKFKKGDVNFFGALYDAKKEYRFFYEEGSAPKEESPAMTE